MEPVEGKLAEWKTIYDQLQTARTKRKTAFNRKGAAKELDDLDAEVAKLQKAHDAALSGIYQAISATKR